MKNQPGRLAPKGRKPLTSAPREKKLTIRQRKFIDGKLKGKSSAKAAREAGYSESVARHADRIISESPHVRAAINAVLEACGITDELLAKRVAEGVDATVFLRPTLHDTERVLVDFRERREMVELACRLKGHLTEKHHVRVGKTLEEILEEANQAES